MTFIDEDPRDTDPRSKREIVLHGNPFSNHHDRDGDEEDL